MKKIRSDGLDDVVYILYIKRYAISTFSGLGRDDVANDDV
jgi:hypothetical protein